MRLEHSPAVVKRGARSLVHHAPCSTLPPLDDNGINPIRRHELPGRQLSQIDGRNSQLAATAISLPYPPYHTIGAAQHSTGGVKIPSGHRSPDSATGNQ